MYIYICILPCALFSPSPASDFLVAPSPGLPPAGLPVQEGRPGKFGEHRGELTIKV